VLFRNTLRSSLTRAGNKVRHLSGSPAFCNATACRPSRRGRSYKARQPFFQNLATFLPGVPTCQKLQLTARQAVVPIFRPSHAYPARGLLYHTRLNCIREANPTLLVAESSPRFLATYPQKASVGRLPPRQPPASTPIKEPPVSHLLPPAGGSLLFSCTAAAPARLQIGTPRLTRTAFHDTLLHPAIEKCRRKINNSKISFQTSQIIYFLTCSPPILVLNCVSPLGDAALVEIVASD